MLVIMSDIHGLFKPMKFLISNIIKEYERKTDNLQFIFLGDYIDRGSESKEVIDFLIEFDYEKIFLLGNHEDFMINFFLGKNIDLKYSWLNKNNGAIYTIKQFINNTNDDFDISNLEFQKKLIDLSRKIKLNKKYINFLMKLKFMYDKKIYLADNKFEILFSHSIPNMNIPIEEIILCKSYEKYKKMNRKYNISIGKSNIWNREFLLEPINKYTLIHGHTPTLIAPKTLRNVIIDKNDFSKGEIFISRYEKNNKVIEIDIDTSAIYNKRLTAIIIPENENEYQNFGKSNPIYVEIQDDYYSNVKTDNKINIDLKQFNN